MAQAESAQHASRPVRSAELLVVLWRLLASAQFAITVILFLAVAGFLAVVLPQIPPAIQGSPAAVDTWLESHRANFGFMTEPMHRAGLFTVVRSWWFIAVLGITAVAIGIYVIDRFLDIWRNVTKPREQLPDSFFGRAANRVAFVAPDVDAAPIEQRLEALLSARRYKVRRAVEGETTYLFADRFAWAQLGTFASHLALVLFLVGGLVSQLGGFTSAMLIAEGTTSPVFAVSHPDQMQIEVIDAVGLFSEGGTPTDYRTELVIYQGGEEVARGFTTVNDPISYNGYRFHQSGYVGEGVALRISDVETGNTTYSEVLALSELSPGPHIVVRDRAGVVLLDDVIVPTDFIEEANGTLITVPGTGRDFWVGILPNVTDETWSLAVFERDDNEASFIVPMGEPHEAGGLEWTLEAVNGLPSIVSDGITDEGRALTVLSETPEGEPYLTIVGDFGGQALTLLTGEPATVGDREYLFEGPREFAGIEVRKDPGVKFIWIASGLLLAGLLATFYVPRLRLWARIRGGEAVLASVAERRGVFQSEVKHLLAALDAARIEPEEVTKESD